MTRETLCRMPDLFAILGEADSRALRELLDHDPALVNARDAQGCTPLLRAVEVERHDLVRLLLDRGADPCASDEHGVTPLHVAGSLEVAQWLLSAGADVHARNRYGLSPLHTAVLDGRIDVTDLLIALGADLHAVDAKGFTPLLMAKEYGHYALAALLEHHGAEF